MAHNMPDRKADGLPNWQVVAGRFLVLIALVSVMIAVLTAAQISHAYLTASGGGGGVSAVAIKDDALAFIEQRSNRNDAAKRIREIRDEQVAMRRVIGEASVLEYVHKVQFRRIVFSCYPTALSAVPAQSGPADSGSSELSWATLLSVYRAATNVPADEQCAPLATHRTGIPDPLGKRALDPADVVQPCQQSMPPRERLECLWDNVTAAVQLTSSAEQRLATLTAELVDQQTYITQLDTSFGGRPCSRTPGVGAP